MAGVKKNKTNLNIIDYSPQLFVAVLKGEKVFVLARFVVVVVVVGEEALIAANPTQPDGHDFENASGAEVPFLRWFSS